MATLANRLMVCGLLSSLAAGAAPAEVVVVVSAENPERILSQAELADIYLGRRNRYPNGDPVVPIDYREGSTTHQTFYREFLGRTPAQIKAHWSRLIFTGRGQPPRTVSNGEEMASMMAEDSHFIGYIESDLVDERLRVVPIE